MFGTIVRKKIVIHDARPVFNMLDIEREESTKEDARIARAANRAMLLVDAETVAMFRKYKLPLPRRFTDTTWKRPNYHISKTA